MKRRVVLPVVFLLLLAAAPAAAQLIGEPQSNRPNRGLFGGGLPLDASQSLILNGSIGGGYDIRVKGNQIGTVADVNLAQPGRGMFGQGSASLSYSLKKSRVSIGASINGAVSYQPTRFNSTVFQDGAGVSASVELTKRTRVSGSQAFSYQPFFLRQPSFSGIFDQLFMQVVIYEDAVQTIKDQMWSSQSAVSLSHLFTKRMSAHAEYGYGTTSTTSGLFDIRRKNYGGSLQYAIGKGLSLRAGYAESEGGYGESQVRVGRSHSFDGGIDFNRSLSISRHLVLAFNTGAVAINDGRTTRYLLTGIGSVQLSREIGRTWFAGIGYGRDAYFSDTLQEPVLSDAVRGSFGGLISRALQFQSGITSSTGHVGLSKSSNRFLNYTARAGLRLAFTRHIGIGLDYFYDHYEFGGDVSLPIGLLRARDRQSIRASLDFWTPLMSQSQRRRANAAR
jgi:hypothetical protein